MQPSARSTSRWLPSSLRLHAVAGSDGRPDRELPCRADHSVVQEPGLGSTTLWHSMSLSYRGDESQL